MKINKILLSVFITILGLSLVACGGGGGGGKSVTVGGQGSSPVTGEESNVTFLVTTKKIADGSVIELTTAPSGITLVGSPVITNGTATITINVATSVDAGKYDLAISVGGKTAKFTLEVFGADAPRIVSVTPAAATVTAGNAINVVVVTANVEDGATISLTTPPTGIAIATAEPKIASDTATISVSVAANVAAGVKNLTLAVEGASSLGFSFEVTAAGAKKVTVSETQVGGFASEGFAGAVYFVVETEGIAADAPITLKSTVAGTKIAEGSIVSDATGTQFVIETTATAAAGTHDLQITVDGTDSNVFELFVGNAVEKFDISFWNGWPNRPVDWPPAGDNQPNAGVGTKVGTTPASTGSMSNTASVSSPVHVTLDANLDSAWGLPGADSTTQPITGTANTPSWGWRGVDPGDYTAVIIRLEEATDKDFTLMLQYTDGSGADDWNQVQQRLTIKAGETSGIIAINPEFLAASIKVDQVADETEKRLRVMVAPYDPDNDLPSMATMTDEEKAAHIAGGHDLFDFKVVEFAFIKATYNEPGVLYDMQKDTGLSRWNGGSSAYHPNGWLQLIGHDGAGTNLGAVYESAVDTTTPGAFTVTQGKRTGSSQGFVLLLTQFNTITKPLHSYRIEYKGRLVNVGDDSGQANQGRFRLENGNNPSPGAPVGTPEATGNVLLLSNGMTVDVGAKSSEFSLEWTFTAEEAVAMRNAANSRISFGDVRTSWNQAAGGNPGSYGRDWSIEYTHIKVVEIPPAK